MLVGAVLGRHGEEIDQGLAWIFRCPNSFTGEDVAEISAHGSVMVLEALVRAALDYGAVLAEPGEFTRRAFLNGKMDLVQAEAVADLINAAGQFSLDQAYGLLKGQLSSRIRSIGQHISKVLAQVGALLDFPDDVVLAAPALRPTLGSAIEQCSALTGTFSTYLRRKEGAGVAIIGPPNVGKSSIFNLLLSESRAIVSPLPGTTRDLIEARLYLGGQICRLIDTAGIRSADDPVELEGVERALSAFEQADLVLLVLDISHPWEPGFEALLARAKPDRCLLVLNKADLPSHLSLPENLLFHTVRLSALTGEGLAQVLEFLRCRQVLSQERPEIGVTRQRHLQSLMRVQHHLGLADTQLQQEIPLAECVAEDLRLALNEIDLLLGAKFSEEALNIIFSEFCIGK